MKQLLHRITLMATVAMFTFQTFANGYEYNGIHYILDEATKTASVTYTGETPENNSYSGDLELPTKFKVNNEYYRVTSIGEKAFYGCKGIDYINISGLITQIGSQAFSNNDMSSIIIPDCVTAIAADAFKGSNISVYMLSELTDYSFLNEIGANNVVAAPEAALNKIMEVWKGLPKDISTPYYLTDLSTMSYAALRVDKTEYYSLPNAPVFELSSIITHGVEIFADENGVYYWKNLSPGYICEFVINYNIDGEDLAEIVRLKVPGPKAYCDDIKIGTTTFSAIISADEDDTYIATEKGIVIDGTSYKADETGKVTISNLTEDKEYTAKPYAVYNNKTYYGEEFTFTTKNSTGIAATTESEAKVTLNNASGEGYIEVAISSENDATYSIINITGQKEKEGVLAGENKTNTIQTSELTPGIYLINVAGDKLNKTLKFVIR